MAQWIRHWTADSALASSTAARNLENKRLQVAFTHARVHMGASVYSPGPEED